MAGIKANRANHNQEATTVYPPQQPIQPTDQSPYDYYMSARSGSYGSPTGQSPMDQFPGHVGVPQMPAMPGIPLGTGAVTPMPGDAHNSFHAANMDAYRLVQEKMYGPMQFQAQLQNQQAAQQHNYAMDELKAKLAAEMEARRMEFEEAGRGRGLQLEMQRRGFVNQDYSGAQDLYRNYGIRMGDGF